MDKIKAYYLIVFISLFSFLKSENDDYFFFYNLNQGANLLSFPLITQDNEIDDFFSNENSNLISNYDIPSNLISIISEGEIGLYNNENWAGSLDEIFTDKGYWLILEEPISFLYNGSEINNTNYFLHPGCNLISYPYNTEQSIYDVLPVYTEDILTAIIGQNESLLIYNNQFYGSLHTFRPGTGYWFISNDYSIFQYGDQIENNSMNFTNQILDDESEPINQSILQSIYFIESIFVSGYENLEELSLNVYCDEIIVGQKNWENKFSDLIAMGNDGFGWTDDYCITNQYINIKNNIDEEFYILRGSDQWVANNYSILTLSDVPPGDLNFDHSINIGDIIIMIEHITGLNNINNPHKALLADINLDEVINISDILINIEYILNN